VNFIFFINIIYALFNKLKAFNTPDSYKYRHRYSIIVVVAAAAVIAAIFVATGSKKIISN